MEDTCIITFCNAPFLQKAQNTIHKIRTVGKYDGDIVVMVGDDLKDIQSGDPKIIIKYFPTIDRTEPLKKLNGISTSDGRDFYRTFQWHKIYGFDTYFKKWKRCWIIDAGMHIFKPLDKILNLPWKGKLLAHSDSYPTYKSKLHDSFEKERFPELYEELCKKYDMNVDYFQCTTLMYDTDLIDETILPRLFDLSHKYVNTKANEQPLVNLIFNCEMKVWEQLKIGDEETFYYDFFERDNHKYYDYIMLKYPKTI